MSMAASCSARRRCSSTSGCRKWATRCCSGGSSRSASVPSQLALEPDAGIWEYRGRPARPHPFRRVVLGRLRPARPDRQAARYRRRARTIGASSASEPAPEILDPRLERGTRRFDRRLRRATNSTPACCCWPSSGWSATTTRASSAPATRSAASCAATAGSCATPTTTISARPRPRFWSAISGTSTRWRAIGRREEARDTVRRAARAAKCLRPVIRGHSPGNRRAVGQSPADLLDGGHHQFGDAAVGQMGGRVVPRLIIVSNRVVVPEPSASRRAGGLAVAVDAALKGREGIWFGWSGKVAPDDEPTRPTVTERQRPHLHHARSRQRRFPGILQRLRQPGAVADPALPGRSRRIHLGRSRRLSAGQRAVRRDAVAAICSRTT